MAAAVGEHAEPPATHRARAQQAVGDVDQLVRRAHALDPGGAAGGVDRARRRDASAPVCEATARAVASVCSIAISTTGLPTRVAASAAAANARPSRKSSA